MLGWRSRFVSWLLFALVFFPSSFSQILKANQSEQISSRHKVLLLQVFSRVNGMNRGVISTFIDVKINRIHQQTEKKRNREHLLVVQKS